MLQSCAIPTSVQEIHIYVFTGQSNARIVFVAISKPQFPLSYFADDGTNSVCSNLFVMLYGFISIKFLLSQVSCKHLLVILKLILISIHGVHFIEVDKYLDLIIRKAHNGKMHTENALISK